MTFMSAVVQVIGWVRYSMQVRLCGQWPVGVARISFRRPLAVASKRGEFGALVQYTFAAGHVYFRIR